MALFALSMNVLGVSKSNGILAALDIDMMDTNG